MSRNHHSNKRVGVFRYSYYDIMFKFFVEQVMDAEFVELPPPTKQTIELGARYSSDYVCTPFKHMVGDYIELLEAGANVLIQVTGPCRLGYYGEMQETILRDMGYDFDMLNFATVTELPAINYIRICREKINPHLSLVRGLRNMLALINMIELMDEANDYYLANAGFEIEHGAFKRTRDEYFEALRHVTCGKEIKEVHRTTMEKYKAIPVNRPEHPIRIGLVGEYYTALVPHSNFDVEQKFIDMGVEVHRMLNLTHRNVHYNEKALRNVVSDYVQYDMGPTSSLTLAAAYQYAKDGFDGIVHMKSAGCTPEIDCVPILQRIGNDMHVPVLSLSYDTQTSDAGLDTRLEAFYDMVAMRKEKMG